MTWFAIILVCISASFHALWNLISKSNASIAFFAAVVCFGFLISLPLLIYFSDFYYLLSAEMWLYVALTGLTHIMCFFALAAAYKHGDISIVYPIARSSPLIMVSISALCLGHGDQISTLCIIGVVIIVSGSFLLPMKSFSDFKIANYYNKMCMFALLAALSTALYSMVDDRALRLLSQLETGLQPWQITLMFMGLMGLANLVVCFSALMMMPQTRAQFLELIKNDKKKAALVALTIKVTYGLVMLAYLYAREVSYVVAFRQLSIPIGALLGVYVLKEMSSVPKFVGIAGILVGLLLVALG
ncbi:MAG: multidrug DMT transporter permease [Planctomycetes bacterium]|nr:multidrug DMT transporter permease [Planctomycetota bacterium]